MPITLQSSGGGSVILTAPSTAANRTATLPDATTTLVGTDTAQTLTNKTISGGQVQGGALTVDTVKNATGTSIDFTGIPSWVKRITVIFDGVSLSGTENFLVQLGDSGGIENTGYASSSTGTTGAAGTTVNSTSGFIVRGVLAANTFYGHMIITNISGNKWISSHCGTADASTAGNFGGGVKTLSDRLDRVSVARIGTDTFDAGTINIMYE